MKKILQSAMAALKSQFNAQPSFEETYLGGAVDIYDLERRMRHLDQRTTQRPFHLQHSI
ncbi:DUF3563 family protein [Variovorax ureilyticus]|uniref:DUF3563 family protein n=1 Tax=Variovorax ureilyticus TaxID=1836198 RepID=A0ABU8VAZ4_9BURK